MFSSQKSKKTSEIFLPFIFISFVCFLLLTHPEKAFSRCGDVDGDGNIFSNDVLMVARASINILTLTADQKLRTDVVVSASDTPDGNIYSNDLLIIARASLGMVTPLCNEGSVGSGKIEGYLADEGSSTKGGITVIVESVEPSTGLSRTAQAIIDNVGAQNSVGVGQNSIGVGQNFVGLELRFQPSTAGYGNPALQGIERLSLDRIVQKITKTAVTDDTGHFSITDLPPGLYTACAIKVPDIQNPNCADAADPKNHPEYAGKEVKIGLLPNIEIKNTTSQVVIGEKDDPNPQFKIAKTSSIRGVVKFKNASNHLGILVFIPGTSFIAMTDVNGEYEISNVPIGQFILAASKAGYSEIMKPGISVEANQITVVPEFEIQPLTTCTISISNISASPMTLYPNDLTTITVTAQSSGCNTLSYSYTPTGGSIIGGGSSVQWQAPAKTGLYSISVVVSDGTKFVYSFVPIFVQKILPPVVSVTANPTSGTAQLTVDFKSTCIDIDGACVSYSWNFGDGSATNTQQNPSHTFINAGTYAVILIATDDKGTPSAEARVTITVLSNHNPTITTTAVTTVTAGTAYSYDVNAADTDGDTLTYSLTTAPTGMTINSTTGLISWTPTTAGSYNVTVSVSDGKGGIVTQSFTIRVVLPIKISAGYNHPCVVFSDGRVKCWGRNMHGQLGNGTATGPEICSPSGSKYYCSTLPISVIGVNNAVSVTAGWGHYGEHSCVVLSDGSVKCWGDNMYGELGNGTATGPETCVGTGVGSPGYSCSTLPISVTGISNAVNITGGEMYTCVVLSEGGIKCWGLNNSGQLGNGATASSFLPVSVVGINNAVSVAAGGVHTCAVLSDGSVKCWGSNGSGQLGNGNTTNSSMPVSVTGISNAVNVTVGSEHTCAVLSDGSIKCWGRGLYGQLGNGSTSYSSSTPVSVSNITNAVSVSAGNQHTCTVLSDGGVKCWGDSYDSGQLGDGSRTISSIPISVSGITNALSVSAGAYYTCAMLSGGSVKCWGGNQYGQLGNGTSTGPETCRYASCSTTPVSVIGIP